MENVLAVLAVGFFGKTDSGFLAALLPKPTKHLRSDYAFS
jgi:hypothetical protein